MQTQIRRTLTAIAALALAATAACATGALNIRPMRRPSMAVAPPNADTRTFLRSFPIRFSTLTLTLSAAASLSDDSNRLKIEVDKFLHSVRSA